MHRASAERCSSLISRPFPCHRSAGSTTFCQAFSHALAA